MPIGEFTAPCPECGWEPAGKEARSMLRRSLGRHFMHEHNMDRKAAMKLAFKVVPRHPDERAADAPRPA